MSFLQKPTPAHGDVLPGDVHPGDVLPGDVLPGDVLPGDGALGSQSDDGSESDDCSESDDGSQSEDGAGGDGLPWDSFPGDGSPSDGNPSDGSPRNDGTSDENFEGLSSSRVHTPSPVRTPSSTPSPVAWVERSANDIMADQAPSKSRDVYERAWVLFGEFLNRDVNQSEPKEEDYIRYFDYLRKAKNYKSSSLWAIHSRVKNCHQRRYGTDPKWKRVYMQLQSYEADYVVKTANVFALDEIEVILQLDNNSAVWVMRKALAAVAICGGLRCCEVRNITLRDVVTDDEGAWVTFRHGKQRGAQKVNEFIVPFNRPKPHLCYATRLINYMDKVGILNISILSGAATCRKGLLPVQLTVQLTKKILQNLFYKFLPQCTYRY